MISSSEVSQMMMAQNAMFSGQAGYAGRIGVSGGLQSYGGGRMPTQHSDLPHGVAPPPAFSYAGAGLTGNSYGIGNKVGAMSMSGLGAAGTVATLGAGFSGMLPGAAGRFLGPMVDPFSAFGLGRGVATGMGMGMAGGIAAGVGMAGASMVPLAIASHGIQSFVQGGQQQSMLNTTLGQNFNFMSGNSRTGQGFSRGEAKAIGDQVRHLSHIPEMMTSVQELTALIPKLKESGAMTGVKDAAEFNRRFKEAVSTIREVSKVLGTTMEEASEFFAHSRRVGILGKTDQLKNAINVQATSALTGMSNGQVMQLQSTGADMATQVGARRSLGTMAVTNTAQTIGAALHSGKITDDQIVDVTGQSGAAGRAAMAERLTGKMMQIGLNSSAGRFMMAGAAKFEDGKYVGMDENVLQGLNSGTMSVDEIRRRGMRNISSRKNKAGFKAREEDIAMEFAGKGGAGALAGLFEGVTGQRFSDLGEEGTTILMKQHGFTAGESDIARGIMNVDARGETERMGRLRSRESAIKEKYSAEAIWKRTKTRIHAALFAGVEQAGAKALTSIEESVDRAVDDLVGRHILTLTKTSSEAVANAFAGNSRELKNMIVDAAGGSGGPTGILGRGLGGGGGGLFGKDEIKQFKRMNNLFGFKTTTKSFLDTQDNLNKGLKLEETGGLGAVSSIMEEATSGIDMRDPKNHREAFDKGREAILDRLSGAFGGATGSRDLNTLLNNPMGVQNASASDLKLLRTLQKAQKQRSLDGMDPITAAMSATQGEFVGRGKQIDFRSLTDSGEAIGYMGAKERVHKLNEATDELKDLGLDEGTIGLLRDDKKLGNILRKGMLDAELGGEKGAMNMQNAELVQRALQAKGHNVTIEQAEKLMTANKKIRGVGDRESEGGVMAFLGSFGDVEYERDANGMMIKDGRGGFVIKKDRSGKRNRLFGALDVFKKEHQLGQRDGVKKQFRDAGVGLRDALAGVDETSDNAGVRKKLNALSTGLTGFADANLDAKNFDGEFGKLSGNFSEAAMALYEDKTLSDADKEEIYKRTPGLRSAVAKVGQAGGLKDKKFKSIEDLAKSLGMNSEGGISALKAAMGKDPQGAFQLSNADQIKAIQKAASGYAGGHGLAEDGANNLGKGRDLPSVLGTLDATLKKVDSTLSLVGTVMATTEEGKAALKKHNEKLEKPVEGTQENAPLPGKGQ